MNSKGKDRGWLRPPGGVVLARNKRARSPGSPNARPGARCAALLSQLQCPGLRQTPSSSPNYGRSLPHGPFSLKLCGAVWSCRVGLGVGFVVIGVCRSKWGAGGEIWVGQWRTGRGGAPRSGTTGRPPGLTSQEPLWWAGQSGPKGVSFPLPSLTARKSPGFCVRTFPSAPSPISVFISTTHSFHLEVDLE